MKLMQWLGRVLLLPALLCAASTSTAQPRPGECPQPRFTGKAPDEYYLRKSPLEAPDEKTGARLYAGSGNDGSCAICHGKRGDGKGALSKLYDPPPRNFACAMTVIGVPDGQLFWIIRFGSPGTGMPPHPQLSENDVWQLVAYLRTLAK